jgi:phosphatidylglycerol:prolipoprotein diacylglycerol transferase
LDVGLLAQLAVPFWILVAIGIALGARVTVQRGQQLGLPRSSLRQLMTAMLVAGFVAARLLYLVAERPSEQPLRWLDIIAPAGRLSSVGGFVGAVVMLRWWTHRRQLPIAPYADALAAGFPLGWLFGRLGSFMAHHHPGRLTHCFLGVHYPDGVRHDLGLDEALYAATIALLFRLLRRRVRPVGTYTTILIVTYAPMRFALDFLRTTDRRYFGLTLAQAGCFLLWAAAMYLATATLLATTETRAPSRLHHERANEDQRRQQS